MTALPRPTTTLTTDDARRIALRAQGFLGAPDRRAGVRGVLRHLGAVQLDTISVLARSHELVPYARLGAVGRRTVEAAYWKGTHAFEYWSHAACILPVEEWPHFAFRRRAYRGRPHWNHELPDGAYEQVIKQLRAQGPLTATELGGAKKTNDWWDWSGTKVAVERALMYGEVVCVERRGWKRVYDLAERAIPQVLLHDQLDDAECLRRLVRLAGEFLGVGTRADIADYHRLKGEQVDAVIADSGLVPVEVEGWGRPAWADPAALAAPLRGRHRTTLLSPFDSLIWERARTERIFGFTHRLEAYVPKPKRVHGYFAMPLLAGGQLVGRVDPAREGRTLVAKQVTLDGPKAVPAAAQALIEAASWVNCTDVRVERVNAPGLREPLTRELARVLA
ncbi:winged helix-turn-helix domain-containing protein [Streptomyces pluripotens]|uniref:Winged helix-turn-helix domain-containing protein n=1 Tax=Streptomyces pluripotens TaxID=1355015 RepID=A0A221NY71_9ACTN|nr:MULTISPECIES: crosslink repair DNA glycosylase YcaQ family protein [Streptomyces]ARP70519.1 cytoplasmic protein [Streptomyces pluripotens]ASN24776.1 winged helix-turn-helix domain-containing protein [Streptomyces pluripotens]KIE28919.1 cytoplasmic protein [Streptomyces sp. MUSC 125]